MKNVAKSYTIAEPSACAIRKFVLVSVETHQFEIVVIRRMFRWATASCQPYRTASLVLTYSILPSFTILIALRFYDSLTYKTEKHSNFLIFSTLSDTRKKNKYEVWYSVGDIEQHLNYCLPCTCWLSPRQACSGSYSTFTSRIVHLRDRNSISHEQFSSLYSIVEHMLDFEKHFS